MLTGAKKKSRETVGEKDWGFKASEYMMRFV